MAAWLLSAALLCGQLPVTALAAENAAGPPVMTVSDSDSDTGAEPGGGSDEETKPEGGTSGEETKSGDETLPDVSTISESDQKIIGNDEDGIPNKVLYDYLVNKVGGKENFTVGQARQITDMYLYSFTGNLKNLSKYLTGLKSLSLYGESSEISLAEEDIQEIAAMTGLSSLELHSIKADSLELLSSLHELTSLTLSGNDLKDISFISVSAFPVLKSLSIQNPVYKMPDSFSELKALETLYMSSCELRELADLKGLDKLTTLSLWNNYLTQDMILNHVPEQFTSDSSWLQSNVNMNYDPSTDEYYPENRVEIANDENGIPDPKLYEEMLRQGDTYNGGNQDGKLTVAEARRISYLSVTGVENLKNLSLYAPNVTSLNLYRDYQVEQISVLSKESIQEIAGLTKLYSLQINYLTIEDIAPIAVLHNLTSLNLSNNKLSAEDITVINGENYPVLNDLTISNPIYKMPDEIATLPSLRYLNMSGSQLRELADLTGMDQLETLSLYNNYLLEKEIIAHVPERFSADSAWLTNAVNPNYDPTTDEYYPENKRVIENNENGIPDAELYALLLEKGDEWNGNKDGILTVAEARRIRDLSCNYEIKDYTNLSKWAPNLQSLYFNNYSANSWTEAVSHSFYSELEQLEKLSSLQMHVYSQEDLEQISKKISLTNLSVYLPNDSINLSCIASLENLVGLSLYSMPDAVDTSQLLQVINSLSKLESLSLSGHIDSIHTVLSEMSPEIKNHLTYLYATSAIVTGQENIVYDFSDYLNLNTLNIDTSFKSVTGLDKLENLFSLYLNNNGMDLAETDNLPSSVSNLQLSQINMESLAENSNILLLTKLNTLQITRGNLKDIKGIGSLNQLRYLYLQNNQLQSIEDISNLTELDTLNLNHNRISDITGIEKLTKLRDMDLSNNQISDINPIQHMTGLYRLDLENNRIQELPDLTGLTELTKSHYYYNDIYSNLVLSGNLLTEDAVMGKVPSFFTDNKVWLARVAAAKPNYDYYYSSLDSDTLYNIVTQNHSPAVDIYTNIYMKEDAQLECSAELLQILEEDNIRIDVRFGNPEELSTKTIFYIGKGRPVNGDPEKGIILKNLDLPVNAEEEALVKENFTEYGDIPIYFVKCPSDLVEQGIPYEYLLNQENGGYGLNVYFYDRTKNNILNISSNLYARNYWANYTTDYQDGNTTYRLLPERNRTEEEGFYFLVSGQYPLVYSHLDSESLYQLITHGRDPAVNIYTTVNVKENGQVECSADLLKTMEKDNIQVNVVFGSKQTHDTGIRYYLGKGYPSNMQKGVTLRKPDFSVDEAEKKIAETYFSEYGDIPIYYFKNVSFILEQKVTFDYTIDTGQEEWANYSVYFYDRVQEKVQKINNLGFGGSRYLNWSNYRYQYNQDTNQSERVLFEPVNRAPEEGFYFIVNSKYTVNTNNEGVYTDPKRYEGEYFDNSSVSMNDVLDKMVTEAGQGDTVKLAYTGYAYVTADVWNRAVDKNLNWEIIEVNRNGGLLSDLKIQAEDTYKVSENSSIGLSVNVYSFNTSDPNLNEMLGNYHAATLYVGALSRNAELTVYVGDQFKNGEKLELYFFNYEAVMSGNNSKVTVEEAGVEAAVVSYGMATFNTNGRNSNMFLVNGKLDLDTPDVPDEPDTPDVPDNPDVPDTPDEPDIPDVPDTPDEPDIPDVPDTPDEPDTPDVPDTPDNPDVPDIPDIPDTPDVPDEQPSKPTVIDKNEIIPADNTNNSLLDKMDGLRKDVKVVVEKKENEPLTLAKDVFDNMLAKRKNVSVSVVNEKNELQYGWTFPIDDSRVDPAKFADIDLSIQFNTDKKEEIEAITGQTNSLYLEFAHHGELPIPATIRNYVGDTYRDGEVVYLYYYNQESNKVEAIKDGEGRMGLTVENGYVTYTITHCSVYFLATEKPGELNVSVEDQSGKPEEPSGDSQDSNGGSHNEEASRNEAQSSVSDTSYVKSPLTGESSREFYWMLMLAALGLTCAAICLKKAREQ